MSYAAPSLAAAVVLQAGYGPPALSTPVVLTDGGPPPGGVLDVSLAPSVPPVVVGIAGSTGYAGTLVAAPALLAPVVAAAGVATTGYHGALAATCPPPSVPLSASGSADLDMALPDSAAVAAATPHRHAPAEVTAAALAHAEARPARARTAASHTAALSRSARSAVRHADALQSRRPAAMPHAHGPSRRQGAALHHADTLRTRRPATAPHQEAAPIRQGLWACHADTIVHRPRRGMRWGRDPQHVRRLAAGHQQGLGARARQRVRWQHGTTPKPGRWWPTYEPPGLRIVLHATNYTPRPLACQVVLGPTFVPQPPCSGEPPREPIVIPTLRSYIVINDVTLLRVSNNLPLPTLSLQIGIDADSWVWGWSASMSARQLDNLERDAPGSPVELEAQINGVIWRLVVERVSRDRRFGQDRISVSGRGIAAQLADPIYPAESRDNTAGAMTAQQLAAAALTYNGVPLGWDIDWQIADWLVPAGAWVHTGTPIEAVARIAAAAGGYVQADPAAQILHVLPRYPLLPWEWAAATPDVILPSAVTTREGTEYLDRPNYNAVYVSGGAVGGVLGQVTIAGTAGDVPAEMVTDALVTHVDAARGRGAAILGNTGRQRLLTLETPILADVGLYGVGTLLESQDGTATARGLVRSVAVSAQQPRVRQTIEVETHA